MSNENAEMTDVNACAENINQHLEEATTRAIVIYDLNDTMYDANITTTNKGSLAMIAIVVALLAIVGVVIGVTLGRRRRKEEGDE